MSENEISQETKAHLTLFKKIMEIEHENKRRKQFSEKEMQDKIKKLIQTYIHSDDEQKIL